MDNNTPATEPTSSPPPVTALARRSPFDQVRELVTYLKEIDDLANVLCKSTLLPRDMQTPANLKLVLMQGLEMGFSVVQAVRASFIITSKDAPPRVGYYVEALVALVRSSSVCRFFRVEVCTAEQCRVVCARKDEDEAMVHVFEMSMAQAQKANLDKKWERSDDGRPVAKQKYTWLTAPSDMLRNRTCGRAVKSVFQDVVFGMATPDELDDVGQAEVIERTQDFVPVQRWAEPAAATTQRTTTTREPDVVEAELVPDEAPRGTGDPAWDEVLRALGQLAGVDMGDWIPSEVTAAWDERVAACGSKKDLNALAPWIGIASSRTGRSRACSELAAHMSRTFNERSSKLRTKTDGAA